MKLLRINIQENKELENKIKFLLLEFYCFRLN